MEKLKPAPLAQVERRISAAEKSYWVPIDRGIRPLVIGLNRWRVRTVWSCIGHRRQGNLPYVMIDKAHAVRALYLADLWDRTPDSAFTWVLTQGIRVTGRPDAVHDTPFPFFELSPLGRKDRGRIRLPDAQREARAFGAFLLNVRQASIDSL